MTTELGGSLIYGQSEIITKADKGIWLISFCNINGSIELIGQKTPVTYIPIEQAPLQFTAVQDNSAVALNKIGTPYQISLQYKLNNNQWTNYTIGDIISLSSINDTVAFSGSTNVFSKDISYYNFAMSGKIQANGNINSLINCAQLTPYCYYKMFYNCSSLITAPLFPAVNLANNCYRDIFYNCVHLTTAPQLPATNLAVHCYTGMFASCTSLINIPQLPATTLTNRCYYWMFTDCTSLTTAPQLPATTLQYQCYAGMFYNCTSLTTAPQLPASVLSDGCYMNMFAHCTSLTTAPQLPAVTLADSCYCGMFNGCSSLTTAPQLPASTLADICYYWMFADCTSLTTAPQLPATTLTPSCYYWMFGGCTSLSSINVSFTSWNSNTNTINWLTSVKNDSSCIFTCPSALGTQATITRGPSNCPTNWTVINK